MPARRAPGHPAALLPPFDDDGRLNAVVDTPRGSRAKYRYDERRGVFTVAHLLAAGHAMPCEFAFVPGTRGGDGDPLDALVLFDDATFPGCLLPARPLGVLRAEQDDGEGGTERNDRIVAAAADAHLYRDLQALDDVPGGLLAELEHFLVSYNAARGRRFTLLGRGDAAAARRLVRAHASAPSATRAPRAPRGRR